MTSFMLAAALNIILNATSIKSSNMRTFCSSGAFAMISDMNDGSNSVTRLTPAAKVPSGAEGPNVCPALRACSTQPLVTESTTYRTPNLCVAGAFLKCVYTRCMRTVSD